MFSKSMRGNATGLDVVIMNDESYGAVPFIRKKLVEQREADLLNQLEVAEDTVDVLEQLLQKHGAEILRLRSHVDAIRQLHTPNPAPAPMPVVNPVNVPWTWPNQQTPMFPWNDMNKVWCDANGQNYKLLDVQTVGDIMSMSVVRV